LPQADEEDAMTWRTWVAGQLRAYVPLTDIIPPKYMRAAGSMTGRPDQVPFLIVEVGANYAGPYPSVSEQDLYIHVHDAPGDYMQIDDVINKVRLALMSGEDVQTAPARTPDGVACAWQNESRDLADDMYGTIYKTATFTLRGKMTDA
jgi:hypothetical protein